jgi:stearoyl-CoA desaturase (delta-9 desaturase)
MFWWMTPDITSRHTPEYLAKWAPDLLKDPVHRWLDQWHFAITITTAILFFVIGGLPGLVWGFFVRSVLVLHTTWLVNSATHVWGYRSHETRDRSTNLWWVAAVTYGEGWHNNHHAYQTSAAHGLSWWELDPTYWMIRLMQALGLAYNVKMPKQSQIEAKSLSLKESSGTPSSKPRPKRPQSDAAELVGSRD